MSRTGWGLTVGAAILISIGWVTGMRELSVLGLAAGVAVATGFVLGRRRPPISVVRDLDPLRATVGDVALVRVTLRNTGTRSTSSVEFEELIAGEPTTLSFGRLRPGQARSVTYRPPTNRRGVVRLGPGAVRSGDPFGVLHGTVEIGDTSELIVHPHRHRIDSFPRAARRTLDGPEAQNAALGSMVFHTLREYVPGDDLRHVHWKSSARAGSMMVRQFVDTDTPDLTVVLDVGLGVYDGDDFESACEAACSLVEAFHRLGFSIRLVTSAGATVIGGDTVQMLDLIARLEPVQGADLSVALQSVPTRLSGAAVAVITGACNDDVARSAARVSGRDRVVVLVEIRPDAGAVGFVARGDLQRMQVVDGADFASTWNSTVRW